MCTEIDKERERVYIRLQSWSFNVGCIQVDYKGKYEWKGNLVSSVPIIEKWVVEKAENCWLSGAIFLIFSLWGPPPNPTKRISLVASKREKQVWSIKFGRGHGDGVIKEGPRWAALNGEEVGRWMKERQNEGNFMHAGE